MSKIQGNRIYNDYIQFVDNLKELKEIRENNKIPKKDYNLSIKFISDYKYYKK